MGSAAQSRWVLILCSGLTVFWSLAWLQTPPPLATDMEMETPIEGEQEYPIEGTWEYPSIETFHLPPPIPNMHDYLVARIGQENGTPLEHCRATAQFTLTTTRPRWTLQAVDDEGHAKYFGGDEFYVTYHHSVAKVEDHRNGTYSLDFVTPPLPRHREEPPPARGNLTVHMQYTCGMGFLPPPTKENWTSGGAIDHSITVEVPKPPIRSLKLPNPGIFQPYDLVVGVGDSLMMNLFRWLNNTRFSDKGVNYLNLGSELNTTRVESHFVHPLRKARYYNMLKGDNVALFFGSATWDVIQDENRQGVTFGDHAEACRQWVQGIRKLYPNVTLFWRTASDLHVHRVDPACHRRVSCWKRVLYMSTSRMQQADRVQRAVMKEMNVSMIDLTDAYFLSADDTMPGDGRHFTEEFNHFVHNWLFYGGVGRDR